MVGAHLDSAAEAGGARLRRADPRGRYRYRDRKQLEFDADSDSDPDADIPEARLGTALRLVRTLAPPEAGHGGVGRDSVEPLLGVGIGIGIGIERG